MFFDIVFIPPQAMSACNIYHFVYILVYKVYIQQSLSKFEDECDNVFYFGSTFI